MEKGEAEVPADDGTAEGGRNLPKGSEQAPRGTDEKGAASGETEGKTGKGREPGGRSN